MAEVDTLDKPPKAEEAAATTPQPDSNIKYVNYQSEAQMPDIMQLVKRDLSEPYSVYTYRYFINTWEKLCFMAYDGDKCIGAIVCKLDPRDKTEQPQSADHNDNDEQKQQQEEPELTYKGYIAMLVVEREYRKKKIGSRLVKMAVTAMKESKADEVILETEVPNKPALKLYENLGFLRDKRLFRYYLNGLDALRLRLWIN